MFGSVIDTVNRGALAAFLALGMTLVIASSGIDLFVVAVMTIIGVACELWNGFLITILRSNLSSPR
ncbi:MAG: Inner membrane ABC transporter permease protein YtfT [Sodalis sp.]|nr:MAG: Inner membrane ABC transporter permease protein YtfT [Sodalis sp.]